MSWLLLATPRAQGKQPVQGRPMTPSTQERFILRASCPDAVGIIADVAVFLAERRLFIVETANFGDAASGQFFMRLVFAPESSGFTIAKFTAEFSALAARWSMEWEIRDARARPNVLILVSQSDHCLNDLLYRQRIGALHMNVPAIVSNHLTCAWLAERHGIPYYHLPTDRDGKEATEARILELAVSLKADLVVLARYMQILSDGFISRLQGRCINIHHSFLPGFKGARPYHQAHVRGVKVIGATAHYVTGDLDEGPIIEQDVERISHRDSPDDLIRKGRDIERRVLARAVRYHLEDRVVLNGRKTVVFTD
jgi:formyltetrahydrofolate deformylase